MTNYVSMHRGSMKGPPNIFKESYRINTATKYIKKKLNHRIHIKNKNDSFISRHMRKYYYDMKWNFIFINKLYRDIPGLLKKSLYYTYNLLYKYTVINIQMVNQNNSGSQFSQELRYRAILYILLYQYQENIKSHTQRTKNALTQQYIANIKGLLNGITEKLYLTIILIVGKENINNIIRNRIINYYMPYVNIMSKQYLRSGYYADISDLVQEGTLGVIEAAERYQLGRGVRFLTYAYWWMHRYMIKIAIKKKKIFKLNKKAKIQKRLLLRINVLYEHIRRKLNNIQTSSDTIQKYRNIYQNDINQYNLLRNKLLHKDFVIYALYKGIQPYKEHTIEEICQIFEVPEYIIQGSLKRISKIMAKV